jgi:hypothetical protein
MSSRAMTDLGDVYRGRLLGLVVAAVPTVSFVVTNAASSLHPAIAIAAAVALLGFAVELARHQPLWHAAAGLLIVAACAAVAAGTGQARGFFLLPMLVPFTVIALSLGSLAMAKPLTGLILNRVSGGPSDWTQIPRLYRSYVMTTWATIGFQAVSAALQVTFYRANDTLALGVLHVVTGPISAGIIAVTVVSTRRVMRPVAGGVSP